MSRYNISYMMEKYHDDFGNTYKNVPFKIQGFAPLLAQFYQARKSAVCLQMIMEKRHLKVTFANNRVLKYPVPSQDKIETMVTQLLAQSGNDEALCIDYIGESWNLVYPAYIKGANIEFKTETYSNLPSRKVYKSYNYEYDSDYALESLQNIKLVSRIANDNPDLHNCQKAGMRNPSDGKGICSGNLLEPRSLIIQARNLDAFNSEEFRENKIIRKVPVSELAQIPEVAETIAPCGECLGYQGEIIPNIHILVGEPNVE